VLVAVQDPDDDPGNPEQDDDREEDLREADGEVLVSGGKPEERDDPGRDEDEKGRQAAEGEEQ
jgi:hypothetical protein